MAATSSPTTLPTPAAGAHLQRLRDRAGVRGWQTAAVAGVIGTAMALAAVWVFLVPIFEAPDEEWHADYAFSLYSAGRLLNVRERPVDNGPESRSHPWVMYLGERTGFENIPFNRMVKAPPGYGNVDFYRRLDSAAPPDRPQAASPHLLQAYPFGYYALLALWLGGLHLFTGSLTALFFGARLLSVALLGCSLALAYGICREMRLSKREALGLTALVGVFPLTPFVASYIQPENLSLALVSLCIYTGLRLRRDPLHLPGIAVLGLGAGALIVTKQQFWLSVVPPVLGMLLLVPGRRWARAALALGPSLVAQAVQLWIGWGGPSLDYSQPLKRQMNYAPLAAAAAHGPLSTAAYLFSTAFQGFLDFFALGTANLSFWGMYGWLDTPLTFGPPALSYGVRIAIAVGTLSVLALTLWRLTRVSSRLLRLSRGGRRALALRIALSNPLVNSYFLFMAIMFALYLATGNSFGAQGRNWYPFLLPAFLVAIHYAPKALRRHHARRFVARTLAASLALFTVAAVPASLFDLHARYYGEGRAVVPVTVRDLRAGPVDDRYGIDYVIPSKRSEQPGSTLAVGGWATGAGTLFVAIDGEAFQPAVVGDESEEAARRYGSAYRHAGFDTILPTAGLVPGPHQLHLLIVSRDLRTFTVVQSPYSFRLGS